MAIRTIFIETCPQEGCALSPFLRRRCRCTHGCETVCRLSSIRSCGVKSRASFFISCADISRRVSFSHFGQVRLWLSICLRNLSLYHSITAAMADHTGTSHSSTDEGAPGKCLLRELLFQKQWLPSCLWAAGNFRPFHVSQLRRRRERLPNIKKGECSHCLPPFSSWFLRCVCKNALCLSTKCMRPAYAVELEQEGQKSHISEGEQGSTQYQHRHVAELCFGKQPSEKCHP